LRVYQLLVLFVFVACFSVQIALNLSLKVDFVSRRFC
jgi:hypothetical protein